MSKKMHAAVVREFGKPLVLEEWDVPEVGHGQILVKTEACGVCHTDLHAAKGDWPVKPKPPFIPGHEADRHRRGRRQGRHHRKGRRSRRRAMALLGLRPLRILPQRLGDGLCRGGVWRLHPERRLRRVCARRSHLCCAHPEGPRSEGSGTHHLRGDHDLQGHQADRGSPGRVDRHLGLRWPRPSRHPNTPRQWACMSVRSTSTTASWRSRRRSAPI